MTAYDDEMNKVEEKLVEINSARVAVPDKPTTRIFIASDLHTFQKGKSKRILSEEGV